MAIHFAAARLSDHVPSWRTGFMPSGKASQRGSGAGLLK